MTQPILEAHGLVKRYGALTAVNDIDFAIEEGEVFGLLGPNGAGKSTIIAMLTGFFPPDSGEIRIMGFDAVEEPEKIKHIIGVVPQELALYPSLSGRENLRFFGEMYGLGGNRLTERVESVLATVAMTERASDMVQTYSGGMKRRLNLAVGLINNPRLLFLDEPAAGTDPQSRALIFETVERFNKEQGMAILYTTRHMEEAQRLCHRIALIDHGRIVALNTTRDLVATLGGGIIQVGLPKADEDLCQKVSALSQVKSASYLLAEPGETGLAGDGRVTLKVEARQSSEALIQIIQLFNRENVEILAIKSLEPNLESVFLHLTGKPLSP